MDRGKLNLLILKALQNAVLFVILSPFDHEQFDMIHRLSQESKLELLPVYREFLKCFITNELVKWPRLEEIYSSTLKSNFVFSSKSEDGIKRYSVLHKRVVEHVSIKGFNFLEYSSYC